ncbi:hypothetical protein C0J52_08414, partial [Blattella germanica]
EATGNARTNYWNRTSLKEVREERHQKRFPEEDVCALKSADIFDQVFVTIMVLTTEEKIFILEHYLLSYRVRRHNGPSLRNFGSNLTKFHPVSSRSSAVQDQCTVSGREELDAQESIFQSDDPSRNVPELLEKIKSFLLCHCNNLCSSTCSTI